MCVRGLLVFLPCHAIMFLSCSTKFHYSTLSRRFIPLSFHISINFKKEHPLSVVRVLRNIPWKNLQKGFSSQFLTVQRKPEHNIDEGCELEERRVNIMERRGSLLVPSFSGSHQEPATMEWVVDPPMMMAALPFARLVANKEPVMFERRDKTIRLFSSTFGLNLMPWKRLYFSTWETLIF